jgi:hypothetical protein
MLMGRAGFTGFGNVQVFLARMQSPFNAFRLYLSRQFRKDFPMLAHVGWARQEVPEHYAAFLATTPSPRKS